MGLMDNGDLNTGLLPVRYSVDHDLKTVLFDNQTHVLIQTALVIGSPLNIVFSIFRLSWYQCCPTIFSSDHMLCLIKAPVKLLPNDRWI